MTLPNFFVIVTLKSEEKTVLRLIHYISPINHKHFSIKMELFLNSCTKTDSSCSWDHPWSSPLLGVVNDSKDPPKWKL